MARPAIEEYFATCARYLEPLLADELRALGALKVRQGRGGVRFSGPPEIMYKANLWLRTAVRVLWPILNAEVLSFDDLYDAVYSVDWQRFLTPEQTIAVDANVRDSNMTHSQFAARRVKDAVCDQFVDRVGRRPSVDADAPNVGFNLHVSRNQMVLSLDTSGESLHKRGYRPALNRAPLNEALATALVMMSGWTPDVPLVDPMCGSGSIPIEAAWMAMKRPPGLTRARWGFTGWPDYDRELFHSLRDEARRGMLAGPPSVITGSDSHRGAVEMARTNAKAAGVGHFMEFTVQDVRQVRPPEGIPGVLVCNPPYGERIGEEAELGPLYHSMGQTFRRWEGWKCWLITSKPELAAAVGLPMLSQSPLYNGKIECRLIQFENA